VAEVALVADSNVASSPPLMGATKKLGAAELLYLRAEQMGLKPCWITPHGLFVITTESGEHYIHDARSALNSHVGISLARNKHLTRLILERHNLPNIPFARPKTLEEATAFLHAQQKIIVKPVRGLGAHDIRIVEHTDQLAGLQVSKYIFERYIAGREFRYLVLNDTTIGVHESEYGVSVEADRMLRRISYPAVEWDPILMELSARVARVLGLKFAAVDYLVDEHGKAHILEVNTTPGLKWFHAPTSGPSVDVAYHLLNALLTETTIEQPTEDGVIV